MYTPSCMYIYIYVYVNVLEKKIASASKTMTLQFKIEPHSKKALHFQKRPDVPTQWRTKTIHRLMQERKCYLIYLSPVEDISSLALTLHVLTVGISNKNIQ